MLISIDDACASDVRVADLCSKYEIDCVFYWLVEWNSYALYKDFIPIPMVDAVDIAKHFEIGSHTITHRHLTSIPPDEAMKEIFDSKFLLEALWGREVTKFCPPRGYTNQQLTEFTLTYYDSQRLTKGEHLVHIHPNSGANGNRHWRECITEDTTELWGHSWELDKYDLWDELEDYLAHR